MESTTIYQWLTFILPPLTGIITWFTSRYTRHATTLEAMQQSIDLIMQKNKDLYEELALVRQENADLKQGQLRISAENQGLRNQLDELKQENQELKNLIANLRTQRTKKAK